MTLTPKRNKFGIAALFLTTLFGSIFIAVGVVIFQVTKVDQSWVKTSGTIVDLRVHQGKSSMLFAPVVEYVVDGKTYNVVSNFSTSIRPIIGGTQEVAYNPVQPIESKVVEGSVGYLLFSIFPIVGLIVLIAGIVLFVKSIFRTKRIDYLIKNGRKVQGVISDVRSIGRVNKREIYVIDVSATDLKGQVKNYVSDSIVGANALVMSDFQKNPIVMDVYIDPVNENRYYVDITDIPNLTSEKISELIKSVR